MEQHPVPQNVTTFQFRLIGDMTIKQFGYLAGGAILAYVSYKLPIPFFFSWPLTFIFAVGGVGFAFVPIEERPMEIWVMSFIKNIYSPTQFVWSHEEPVAPKATVKLANTQQVAHPPINKATADVLQQIYAPTPTPGTVHATQSVAHPKTNPFDWMFQLFAPTPKSHAATTPATAVPTPSITGRHLDLSTPPKVTFQPPVAAEPHHSRMLDLQKQLTSVLTERDQMKKEMAAMRTTPSIPTPTPVPAPMPTPSPLPATASRATIVATPQSGSTVNIITPEGAIKAGLPRLTTFPNVVTGITRDSDHNLLPGVLVTVRDADGVPVRALKTNRLGQFAASTPITNGTYLVEIEDPRGRFTFDRAQVTLNGSIVPALEIIAKSQKEVAREKLAKEIFGA